MIRLCLLVLVLIFVNFEAKASCCFGIPKEQISPAEELIQRTKNIVLVRVIKAEYLEPKKRDLNIEKEKLDFYTELAEQTYHPVKYTFEVLQLVKGDSRKFFTMSSEMLFSTDALEHFNFHKDEKFWQNDAGRVYSCEVDKVSFSVGSVYLLFLDKPYHRKSFERIINYQSDSHQDKWLSYVQSKVMSQK